MPLLEVRALTRSYYGVHALRGVDLSVEEGHITGLIGPNGAGKTTLSNCVSGLVPPDAGSVRFAGRAITDWRPDRITGVGLVRAPLNDNPVESTAILVSGGPGMGACTRVNPSSAQVGHTINSGTDVWFSDAVCYAAGTMIHTPEGEVPVERLRAGRQAMTLVDGEQTARQVKWLGHRRFDLASHPRSKPSRRSAS